MQHSKNRTRIYMNMPFKILAISGVCQTYSNRQLQSYTYKADMEFKCKDLKDSCRHLLKEPFPLGLINYQKHSMIHHFQSVLSSH